MSSPPIDPVYARIAASVEQAGYAPGNPLTSTLDDARQAQARYFAFLNGELPAMAQTQDIELQGPAGRFNIRIHRPSHEDTLPIIVFMRGAGWWAGSMTSHDRIARTIALHAHCAIVIVDYHRSPEHAFPTQRDELLYVIGWLRDEGGRMNLDSSRLVLWGESAGATTCLLAAMRLRDRALPPPTGLVLFYGNFDGPKPHLKPQSLWVWRQLLGERFEHPPTDAIPARQSVHDLPPIWIGCGDADPLLEDSDALHARLAAVQPAHVYQVYPGLPHAFTGLCRLFEGAEQAIADAARFAQSLPSPHT